MMTKQLKNRILVFDAPSMRFEEWNGHLRVHNTNLTKANVCEYYGFEIKNHQKYGLNPEQKYRFLRSSEALEKAVNSFKERPILYVHKAADADKLDNSKVIGTTGSDPSFSYPYIKASITIWDGDYIKAIKENRQAELSASYAFTPMMEEGITSEGEPYDGIMTDIYVDHIALVERGRAGHDVRVADSMLGKNMQKFKFNTRGLKLIDVIGKVLNPKETVNDSQSEKIAELVGQTSGVKKKNYIPVITSLLKGNAMASDEEAKQVEEGVKKVMDEDEEDNKEKVHDEDPLDTLEAEDEEEEDPKKKSSASDEEDEKKNKELAASTGDSKLKESWKKVSEQEQATAFDVAAITEKITQDLKFQLRKANEARQLVKPLVGEWASTEDSGEEILREVLTQTTGKKPPASMNYDQLKYTVDLTLSQRQQMRASDSAKVTFNDVERVGATRLRSI